MVDQLLGEVLRPFVWHRKNQSSTLAKDIAFRNLLLGSNLYLGEAHPYQDVHGRFKLVVARALNRNPNPSRHRFNQSCRGIGLARPLMRLR